MNLLHVMPSVARSFGGPTQSLVGYVAAARAAGMRVTVAAPACAGVDQRWLEVQLGDADLRLFPGISRGTFMASPALVEWVKRHARDFDVAHVHGLLNLVSSLSARAAEARGIPVVVRPFGTLSRYTFAHRRGWLKRGYFQAIDRPNLRRARGLHFTTDEERDEAGWHGLDLETRSFVVPPPLHLVAQARQEPTTDVLFLSRLHPIKNIETLLSAWSRVVRERPGLRLTIAGDGESGYVAQLRAQAAGLGESVVFAGFVQGEEKARLLATSRLFVLPSFHENFGVAVIEALAAGLPVVISRDVQLAAFVERHALGRVVKADSEPLAEALLASLDDDALIARCRQDGRRLVADSFSPDAVGQQLRAMYEHVLAS